jgi:hypothetical protein
LTLFDGRTITTVSDAANYFAALSEVERDKYHWRVAIHALDAAIGEPSYLKTATISLQTALTMDGLLSA